MAARGFTRIEIASFQSYCFHFNFGSPTPTELRRMLDDHGLEPICLNYDSGTYQAWDPEEINRFVADSTRKIQHLSEVGIPMMTMSFGMRTTRDDHKYQLANEVKAYDAVAKVGARYGVKMLLEVPHLYGNMWSAEDALWIFARLDNANVGALVDSSHWGIIGYDLRSFLTALGDRLWHVHLRDSDGEDTADFHQQLELTPGDGSVDFRQFGRVLDSLGYAGDVSLDFEYRDRTLGAIETEFSKGLKYLEKMGWDLPDHVRRDAVAMV
jgi:sugar phosphate isomerase/epimerase